MPHQCTNCGRTFSDGSKEMLAGCPNCGGNKFQFHPAGTEPAPAEPPERPDPSDLPGGAATATAVEHGSKAARAVERASTTLKDFVGRSDSGAGASATATAAAADSPEDFAQSSARSDLVHPDELPSEESEPGVDEPERSSDDRERPELGSSGPWPGQDELAPTEERDVIEARPTSEGGVPLEGDSPSTVDTGTVSPELAPDPVDDPATAETAPDTPGRMSLSELREELDDQFESIKILEPGSYEINLMELYEREEYIISLQEDGRYVIEMASTFGN